MSHCSKTTTLWHNYVKAGFIKRSNVLGEDYLSMQEEIKAHVIAEESLELDMNEMSIFHRTSKSINDASQRLESSQVARQKSFSSFD